MTIRMLAFNTVTELCSVALMIDQKIYNHSVILPYLHAENILSMINQLLINTGVELKSLNCIVFDKGPGSFMGIRLGLSVAQGLALGVGLPLITVSSLEVLAQGAWRIFSSKKVISTINARMNELYWARYTRKIHIKYNNWTCITNACLVDFEIIQKIVYELQGKWILVGTGWNNNQQLVSFLNDEIDSIVEKRVLLPEAQDMLSLGLCAYKKNIFFDPNQTNPIYLCANTIKNVSYCR